MTKRERERERERSGGNGERVGVWGRARGWWWWWWQSRLRAARLIEASDENIGLEDETSLRRRRAEKGGGGGEEGEGRRIIQELLACGNEKQSQTGKRRRCGLTPRRRNSAKDSDKRAHFQELARNFPPFVEGRR